MTNEDLPARRDEIEKRWNATLDQVSATAAAINAADPHLANDSDAVTERRKRLKEKGRDLEAIVGEDDSLWLTFFSQGLRAARTVGRVVVPNHPSRPVGTGVLVSRRILLTNNHVIPSAEMAAILKVEMGYEYNDDGDEVTPERCPLDPAAGFFTDVDRDFTVVVVSTVDGAPGDRYGSTRLIAAPGKALRAERLNVIHHPNGDRKRISIRENRMVAEDDTWLRYTSDTEPGSSGAPVFNDQWEMVALHHGAIPRRNRAGRRLTGYMANEGVRVSQIIRRLTATTDPAPKDIVDEILSNGADA